MRALWPALIHTLTPSKQSLPCYFADFQGAKKLRRKEETNVCGFETTGTGETEADRNRLQRQKWHRPEASLLDSEGH